MKRFIYWFALLLFLAVSGCKQRENSFEIKDGDFIYNDKIIRIYSGEIHFARIPEAYWQHRLEMIKAMGMNTVATYVFWNYHETAPGVWDFKTGNRNIAAFIRMAQQAGLFVILRPGPYACAEWELGGFPWWLQKNTNLQLRTDNPAFLDSCKVYIDKLAEQVKDLQITHGGPIIMVQVENEYGSYVEQQHIPLNIAEAYTGTVKKELREAGIDVPLFTSDGSWLFEGGHVSGALPAANGENNVDQLIKAVNTWHDGTGPYMVAEFYPGWLDHWGEPFQEVSTDTVVKRLDNYLKAGVSFNFYMAEGGTNFGFTSGANYNKQHPIQPDITSYDYDAPISEAGWPTPKYYAIREEMSNYLKNSLPPVPDKIGVITLPPISLNRAVDMFEIIKNLKPVMSNHPLTFEDLNQGDGYVLYRRKFSEPVRGLLSVGGLRDYAQVYVNGRLISVLNRMDSLFNCQIDIPTNSLLDIFVENLGRINYGSEMIHNLKGIISPITINDKEITGQWEMYRLPVSVLTSIEGFSNGNTIDHPTIYTADFELQNIGDTFLNMKDWWKGIAVVNGHALGRYWYIGPQQTLYLPGCWLKQGVNQIMIFEERNQQKHTAITTTDTPILKELAKETK